MRPSTGVLAAGLAAVTTALSPLGAGCKPPSNQLDLRGLLPSVAFDALKIEHLDFERLDAALVMSIGNPYSVELTVGAVPWRLGLAGRPVLERAASDGATIASTIAANGSSRIPVPFSLAFAGMFRVASDAGGADHVPFTFDAELPFDTPAGPVSVPFHHDGALPALHLPTVRLTGLRIAALDLPRRRATLDVDVAIDSPQETPLSFDRFTWTATLAGIPVGTGAATIGVVDGSGSAFLPITVDLVQVGGAVSGAITGRRPLDVVVDAEATIGTPFGPVSARFTPSATLTPSSGDPTPSAGR